MTPSVTRRRPRSRIPYAVAFAALACCLVALGAGLAAAGPPKPAKIIGQTQHNPPPLCPQLPSETFVSHHPGTTVKHNCSAVGSVTGYQLEADGVRQAFVAPQTGRIVAWAVQIANTNHYEDQAFGSLDFFGTKHLGGHPTARLSILKKKTKHGHTRLKLVRQSKIEDLKPYQGRKQYFTLDRPLKIKSGSIVGITLPTWAPILASNKHIQQNDLWRASRKPGKCGSTNPDVARQLAISAQPQTKVGSMRRYGCVYTDRLLYWAYYVPGLNRHH